MVGNKNDSGQTLLKLKKNRNFVFREASTRRAQFLSRCESLSHRSFYRLFVELSIFFVTPILVSGFLYCRVAVVLLKRSRKVGRNRALTAAFLLSSIFWALLWIPNYVLLIYSEIFLKTDNTNDGLVSLVREAADSSLGRYYTILTYWSAFR